MKWRGPGGDSRAYRKRGGQNPIGSRDHEDGIDNSGEQPLGADRKEEQAAQVLAWNNGEAVESLKQTVTAQMGNLLRIVEELSKIEARLRAIEERPSPPLAAPPPRRM